MTSATAGLFAIIGLILLSVSQAATLTSSKEAESGMVTGNAGPGDGSGASGNAAVKFGVAPAGAGCIAGGQTPADPNANATVRNLLNCMSQYKGKYIITGQQDSDDGGDQQQALASRNGGVYAAIHGYDHIIGGVVGGNATAMLNQIIAEWQQYKVIPTVSQHWSPTTDTETVPGCGNALGATVTVSELMNGSTATGARYVAWKKNVADDFKVLSDAGVPVLFRPFHEAGNDNCFWWGKLSPADYVAVWKDTFNYMTTARGLHNLVWVFNTLGPNKDQALYPGDAYADMVGGDNYTVKNGDFTGDYNLYRGFSANKLVSVPEVGSVPLLDKLPTVPLVWEMTWSGSYLAPDNTDAQLQAYFADDRAVSRAAIAQYLAGILP